jgi:pre-rRNA-processing protein TSR4
MPEDPELEKESPALDTVHLGFVESIQDEEQLARVGHRSANFDLWDGGQVGGCPSFLNPQHLPMEEIRCQSDDCTTPMSFLCQLYAPVDEMVERAFHRSLYVFGCRHCQAIRVLRCQLPQDNPYYPSDPSTLETSISSGHSSPLSPETYGFHLCQVCGMRGRFKCPLQQLYFCGKEHQREYKKHVFDKIAKGEGPSEFLPSVYPLAELVVDQELDDLVEEHGEDGSPSTLFATNDDGDSDSDADLEQEDLNRMTGRTETVKHDEYTQAFMERIRGQADQALRYARWKEGGGGPLWIRQDHWPLEIPDCPSCGAPRKFEFQLMPQMLDHLNRQAVTSAPKPSETYEYYKAALQQADDVIRELPPENIPPALVDNKERAAAKMRDFLLEQRKAALEWGVVAVYTCVDSCGRLEELTTMDGSSIAGTSSAYREEFAWRQPCLDLS